MTDKELDNLVKQKLAQQTFEYNDAYWQSAEALIDAQRANTAKLGFIKFAFYFTAIGIFTLLGWFLLNSNKLNDNKQLAENKVAENTNLTPSNKEKLAPISNNNQQQVLAENQLANTNQPEKYLTNHIENKVIIPSNKQSKANKNSVLQNNSENVIANNQFVGKENNQEIITANVDNELFLNGKNTSLLEVNLTAPLFDFKTINFVKSPNNIKNNSSITGFFNASFEVGTNSFNQIFNSNSLGYYFGGRLYFDLGKFSFNTNLHYENINQDLAARTYINKSYDFTSNTSNTTIKNQSIDYAILGINAMYPVYKNHSLGIGLQYAQLVQSNDLMSVYNLESNSTVTKNLHNYNSVLNKNDWQLTLNYQFRFAKHFAANAAYVYGINDISNNDLFKSNKDDKNNGIKLGLQYIIK